MDWWSTQKLQIKNVFFIVILCDPCDFDKNIHSFTLSAMDFICGSNNVTSLNNSQSNILKIEEQSVFLRGRPLDIQRGGELGVSGDER